MFLVQRVRDILLRPAQTWRAILTERQDASAVFSGYVMPLAAMAALAVFVGLTGVGVGGWEERQRVPLASGLIGLAAGFLLVLAVVYILAQAVNALAAPFGARPSPRRSMMLVAYASTAAFIGALFALVPALAAVGLLFAGYSVYLLYTGLPVLMRCPPHQVLAYTGLCVACAVLLLGGVGALFLSALPAAGVAPTAVASLPAAASSPAPGATADAEADAPAADEPPRVAAMSRSMRDADARLVEARKAGDAQAAGVALADMKLAITRSGLPPIDPGLMKAALPNRLELGLYLTRVTTHSGRATDVLGGSEVDATYSENGPRRLQVQVIDLGPRGALVKRAEWAGGAEADPAPGHVDKVVREGRRTQRELFRPQASHAEVTMVLANGIIVAVRGDKTDLPTLKKVLTELDVGTLEALQRAPGS